ncbi:MAG: hypothetical protein ABI970_16050 [Chloroflexota bacterium]
MSETEIFSTRKSYGMFAFWMLHTLMLILFLILEANGFHLLVSSLFYFTWIAIWIFHGIVVLLQPRERAMIDDSADINARLLRRIVLGAHSALYVAFGPVVLVWLLLTRPNVYPQAGEGQSLWFYPAWLMVLLAHAAYVMIRDRQRRSVAVAEKRKRDMPRLERLMEPDADTFDTWDDDDYQQKNKR